MEEKQLTTDQKVDKILEIVTVNRIKQARTEAKVHFLGITVFGIVALIVNFAKDKLGM